MMKLLTSAAVLGLAVLPLPAFAQVSPAAAVAAADRPAADKERDADRKPAELISFAAIRSGQTVADLLPGGGYFTRLLSSVVGPQGRVFAVVPSESTARDPKAADGVKAIAAQPNHRNVSVVVTPRDTLALPQPADVAWTSDNYHDIVNGGPGASAAFNAAVFKALKPGGIYIIIDHAAKAGATDAPNKLHRIDPAQVKAEVQAAGFQLVEESNVLARPTDTHELPIFDPSLRGRTDQFVLKFRRP